MDIIFADIERLFEPKGIPCMIGTGFYHWPIWILTGSCCLTFDGGCFILMHCFHPAWFYTSTYRCIVWYWSQTWHMKLGWWFFVGRARTMEWYRAEVYMWWHYMWLNGVEMCKAGLISVPHNDFLIMLYDQVHASGINRITFWWSQYCGWWRIQWRRWLKRWGVWMLASFLWVGAFSRIIAPLFTRCLITPP